MSNDDKTIELRVRARYEGKKTLNDLARQIEDIEQALEKQQSGADKGEASIKQLDLGYQKLEQSLKAVAAAFNASLRYERQAKSLATVSERLEAAKQKQEAFYASLAKGADLTDKQVKEQARLASAVDRANGSLIRARGHLNDTAIVLQRYGIDSGKIADAQAQMSAMVLRGNVALKAQEEAIDRATGAQHRMAGSGVQASLERIKTQLIGMAAAYVSVQQAASLAGDTIGAYSSREGVKNQLTLSVGNDRDAVDREYEYIRGQADRIGIELDRAAKSYAKFAASAALAGKSQKEIRYIWEAFAEVGRVANLSKDDLDGVFKALEQITSKGKIQAEELRGQLGDRLFGAFQVAAKALKDTYPDLDKALKGGEVNAEQLVAIAEEYRKTVAEQLPAATKSLAAEQARLNNTVLDFKLLIADMGFADSFRAALIQITETLKSEDGKKFAEALSAAFSAAADALVWLLKNVDEVVNALKALAALYAINAAGKGVKGLLDYADGLKVLAAEAKLTIKELGLLRGSFAVLQAGLTGWTIGAWANEEFETVRKAGVALVTGLDAMWTRVKYGSLIVWEELPRYAKNAMSAVLNVMTWGTRQMLEVLQKGLQAIGRDDLAANVGKMVGKLTATYEKQGDRVSQIRAQLETDLQKIRDIGQELWDEAERRPKVQAKITATQTERPEIKPAAKLPTEAELAKRQRLVDEITRALDAIDTKVDRAQTHNLQAQLDAIDSQYAGLGAKIAALGGTTGKEFTARLEESLNQLRTQAIAKFNDALAGERAALAAKLDAVDAAAGRKSQTDLEARLTAIRTQYEATYREIEAFRTRLNSNQLPTGEADAARARLDAGIAELQQLETQKFYRDELRRLEGDINNLLSARSDRLKTIADQEAASLITSAEARTQTEQAITAVQPQIEGMIELAQAFAESLRGAFDPLAIDAFIAKLELAKGSGKRLGDSFQITAKQINEMISTRAVQAFDDIAKSLGGVIAGQKSWGDAIKDTGRAFISFAADFLRQLALMIIKVTILKAIQNSGAGGVIGEAISAMLKHDGGVVGQAGKTKQASPFIFTGAPRYHSGGIAGLAPNEYPAILKKNEEVLTDSDPRNILNGGASAGGNQGKPQDVSIANYVDANSFLSAAAATPAGRKIIMNVLSAERSQLRTLIGRT